MNIINVTGEYFATATPSTGKLIFDEEYDVAAHKREIAVAKWLIANFGGNIKLLTEVSKYRVNTADYIWRGKLWELKTVQTEKSADSATRQAIKQISKNPGGIVLDYGDNNLSLTLLQKIIMDRIKRSAIKNVDIMILHSGTVKILRYKNRGISPPQYGET